MTPEFTVSCHVSRPPRDVFEAVADPVLLSRHFATGGARGRLAPDAEVVWSFHDDPGEIPVEVVEVVPDHRIVLRWPSEEGTRTTVTMTFEPVGNGRTRVTIGETGWPATEAGIRTSYGNCEGWTAMLNGLKAYLEHEIVLRMDYYR